MDQPIFNIHDVILLMTLAVCLVLALFQPILAIKNRLASGLLAAFFFSIAVGSLCTLLLWNEYLALSAMTRWLLPYFLSAALLAKGPILYLYVLALTQEAFDLRRKHLLHLLPVAVTALLLAGFQIDSEDLRFRAPDMSETLPPVINLIWYAVKIIPLAYSIAAVIGVHRYQRHLHEHYSAFVVSAPGWLNGLTLGFLVAWSWSFMANILGNLLSLPVARNIGIADNYVTFLLVIALFAYSISYAQHLIAAREEPDTRDNDVETKPSDDLVDKVRQSIEVDKLYLRQNLNIEEFARHIGVHYREVSHTINTHFGTNFFEFINSHRVEEAKRLLVDKQLAHLTILDVLLESGFNSKSAFQRFFKRLTGVSPSEYRKAALGQTVAKD